MMLLRILLGPIGKYLFWVFAGSVVFSFLVFMVNRYEQRIIESVRNEMALEVVRETEKIRREYQDLLDRVDIIGEDTASASDAMIDELSVRQQAIEDMISRDDRNEPVPGIVRDVIRAMREGVR